MLQVFLTAMDEQFLSKRFLTVCTGLYRTGLIKGMHSMCNKVMDQSKKPSTLVFFLNGRKISDDNIDPEWTLLSYLRMKMRLCGTKLGCGEGGCGACTVMVSKYNRKEKRIEHLSVNACLAPIASMHGLAVTTVEGIGSTKTSLHAVQERIAKFHGSQCGFCTPGIVMSMYTLLRNKPIPSSEDLDVYFQGNLCRCTGYRPIIEAFRTFTEPWSQSIMNGMENLHINGETKGEINDDINGDSNGNVNSDASGDSLGDFNGYVNGQFNEMVSNKVIGCSPTGCCRKVDGKCCMDNDASKMNLTVDHIEPYYPDREPIFPPELQLRSSLDEEFLFFKGENMCWYRPTTMDELLRLKKKYPHAKLVVGNTELGIEMKFKHCHYPLMIQPTYVKELTTISDFGSGLMFGASVSLSEIEKVCVKLSNSHPAWKVQVFTEIFNMLQYFGGKQIRNVAGVGGNIMTGSPISDLNPIFLAAGCTLHVRSVSGSRVIKMDDGFFTGYRRNVIKPEEVLVSIEIPYLEENEYFAVFKQSRRRDDDIAIVNSAFRVKLRDQAVEDVSICFGGMAATAVLAKKTMGAMLGRTWGKSMIEDALTKLLEDLPLLPSAPGGMVRYRQSLALSFLFKFYLKVSAILDTCMEHGDESALQPLTKKVLQSNQMYFIDKERDDSLIAVGKPMPHMSGKLQATGEAVYCDDIPKYENELYLGLVLSQKTHAKIVKIDASKALQMQGVHSFVCHEDLPSDRNTFRLVTVADEQVFASFEVKHYGQIIGGIIADDQTIAKKAARRVTVEYDELPATVTVEDAIANESFYPSKKSIVMGDTGEALSSCDHVIEGEMRTGAQEHFYLETHACIAVPKGENGEIELISSTQSPTAVQMIVANCLNIPANRVVCRVKRIGGGFGGKETRATPIALAVAVAATKVGRPVRIMLDRDEDIMISGYRHPFLGKYKIGFSNDGMIEAAEIELYNNCGWTVDLSLCVMEYALTHVTNAYYVPNLRIKGRSCKTNLPSNTAFRGFGSPQAMMIAETWMNDVAISLGKEPAHIRHLNLYKDGQRTYYNQNVEGNSLEECLLECLKQSEYDKGREELNEFNTRNKWKKRGIAVIPVMYGIAFSEPCFNQAGALVNAYLDGSVLLTHGGIEIGQGLHTKMIQIASDGLKVHPSKIHIMETCTDKVPNTSPTAASVSSDINGMAVHNACSELAKRLEPYRKDGKTWEDAVKAAYFDRVSLSATGYYRTPDVGYNFETGEGRLFNYFTNGAACSVVEIDCLTGDHRVLKTDIVMDVGKSLNPAIDIGQIEGAFVQGYGLFVMEQMIHSPSGVPFTRGPGAYKIPGFDDIPAEFNVTLLKDSSNPRVIYSSKGIGEPPLFLSSSVFFAIKDAIKAARVERGLSPIFKLDAPATSERIRMACEDDLTARVPKLEDGSYQPWGIQV